MSRPRALENIRVVDFSWVRAGPWATRWLGAFGAEIIKIEWPENERGRLPSTGVEPDRAVARLPRDLLEPAQIVLGQRDVRRRRVLGHEPGVIELVRSALGSCPRIAEQDDELERKEEKHDEQGQTRA